MDPVFLAIQLLNGIQQGLLLFLIASGLTLIFGVMGVINLAHGAFYMLGAYAAFSLTEMTGDLLLAILLGIPLALALGWVFERVFFRWLYEREHLEQVLLTYGLILIIDESRSVIWGNDPHGVPVPDWLDFSIPLTETLSYPVYRLAVSVVCLALAGAMAYVLGRTRLGMRIRAGEADRETVAALGVDIGTLYAVLFAAGIGLAAFGGMLAAPIESVFPGMGEQVLIISFVVVVIGGIGSVKGAFLAALAIGLVDVFGQVFLPQFASVVVYGLMAAVLIWRPAGLFGRG
ncbi:MAG: branched-chain amino acid ABC transporter permease [Alphaproteobacteria bacterium]|nr:branched-chain amino acid ABC transporter permease [Alphaproteobacteria bacterium]